MSNACILCATVSLLRLPFFKFNGTREGRGLCDSVTCFWHFHGNVCSKAVGSSFEETAARGICVSRVVFTSLRGRSTTHDEGLACIWYELQRQVINTSTYQTIPSAAHITCPTILNGALFLDTILPFG